MLLLLIESLSVNINGCVAIISSALRHYVTINSIRLTVPLSELYASHLIFINSIINTKGRKEGGREGVREKERDNDRLRCNALCLPYRLWMCHCTCHHTQADNHKLWKHEHFTFRHCKPFRIEGKRQKIRVHGFICCSFRKGRR